MNFSIFLIYFLMFLSSSDSLSVIIFFVFFTSLAGLFGFSDFYPIGYFTVNQTLARLPVSDLCLGFHQFNYNIVFSNLIYYLLTVGLGFISALGVNLSSKAGNQPGGQNTGAPGALMLKHTFRIWGYLHMSQAMPNKHCKTANESR